MFFLVYFSRDHFLLFVTDIVEKHTNELMRTASRFRDEPMSCFAFYTQMARAEESAMFSLTDRVHLKCHEIFAVPLTQETEKVSQNIASVL